MIVNFRAREISRDAHKLARTPILIKKKSNTPMIQDIANKVKINPVIRVIVNNVNAENYVRFLGMPLMEEFLESKFSLT
jgi:hypothetical protein